MEESGHGLHARFALPDRLSWSRRPSRAPCTTLLLIAISLGIPMVPACAYVYGAIYSVAVSPLFISEERACGAGRTRIHGH